MSIYFYVGPYVKAVSNVNSENHREAFEVFEDVDFNEDLALHNFNHRKENADEFWLPNKTNKYTSSYATQVENLVESRENGDVCLDNLDMDKECDAFELSYAEPLKFLESCGRKIEVCYGVLVSYA